MQDNDLISRAALIRDIKQHVPTPNTQELYEINLCIINAPTIDAVPVKHGQWIDECCSLCGQYVYRGDARNYCPKCGAKMGGGVT